MKNDYQMLYKNTFSKDIEKHIILVNSRDMDHSEDHSTSNYIIYFDIVFECSGSSSSMIDGIKKIINGTINFILLVILKRFLLVGLVYLF